MSRNPLASVKLSDEASWPLQLNDAAAHGLWGISLGNLVRCAPDVGGLCSFLHPFCHVHRIGPREDVYKYRLYAGYHRRSSITNSSFFESSFSSSPPIRVFIMVCISQALKTLLTASILTQVIAHPGHDLTQEIAERNEFYKTSKRDLSHCNVVLKKRGMEDKQRLRRQAAIEKARAERGLPRVSDPIPL
jgi:hypothetical protein